MTAQIMVIDDEAALRKALAFTLRTAGYRDVVLMENFDKARSVLSKQQPSLIILDILMRGTGGIEALKEIHSRYPDVPVIMLTGVDEVDSAVKCMKLGACDYITKPASESRILECVRSVLVIDIFSKDDDSGSQKSNTRSSTSLLEELRHWAANLRNELKMDTKGKTEPLYEKFLAEFIVSKAYCEPELTIQTLAIRLMTNQKTLSEFVNSTFRMNFRMLINRLRVAEFIRKTTEPDDLVYSIEAIAQETGFDRLATFYNAFKAITNTTPAAWLKSLEDRPST